jgi:hypothetical protein
MPTRVSVRDVYFGIWKHQLSKEGATRRGKSLCEDGGK